MVDANKEFQAWVEQPEVAALIAQLKVEHPDYDDNMIYQMAFMRKPPNDAVGGDIRA